MKRESLKNLALFHPECAPKPDPELATKDVEFFIGKLVKKCFGQERKEHMWVRVEGCVGNVLLGTLDNDPFYIPDLNLGDRVEVRLNEIEDICEVQARGSREKKIQSVACDLVLWHTTKHENVDSILRDGFRDSGHLNRRGIPGAFREYQFPPGVWVGDTPALDDELFDGIGLFGFKAMNQSFIAIWADVGILSHGEEWTDGTWPGRQWLIPAAELNAHPRRQVSLDEVVRLRVEDPKLKPHLPKWVKDDRGYDMEFVERVRIALQCTAEVRDELVQGR